MSILYKKLRVFSGIVLRQSVGCHSSPQFAYTNIDVARMSFCRLIVAALNKLHTLSGSFAYAAHSKNLRTNLSGAMRFMAGHAFLQIPKARFYVVSLQTGGSILNNSVLKLIRTGFVDQRYFVRQLGAHHGNFITEAASAAFVTKASNMP